MVSRSILLGGAQQVSLQRVAECSDHGAANVGLIRVDQQVSCSWLQSITQLNAGCFATFIALISIKGLKEMDNGLRRSQELLSDMRLTDMHHLIM